MQLGFVIDHSKCIGCHACTVACKSENSVPLGKFRTWVKYTEEGAFPEVKRSFAVLRCNQCTTAPCVEICPVRALEKRPDGIVNVDPGACIGCKACMQGCPYDALYLNEATGTAEKCHFCAHRTERGLAPACAVVCPTEAIVPGDFDDPASAVSRLRASHELTARKTEAGTGPNVLYRDVAEAAIDPLKTHAGGGYLWANPVPGLRLEAEEFLAAERVAEEALRARTTYDVDHQPLWGMPVSAYLFTKSLAAGILPASIALLVPSLAGGTLRRELLLLSSCALLFLLVTTALLVFDLKRPARFLTILTRPNWKSWLTRGSVILILYGAVLSSGLFLTWSGRVAAALVVLLALGTPLSLLTASYTGWLFGQAKGRVLWMRRGLWAHLYVQAVAAGAAFALLLHALVGLADPVGSRLRWILVAALALHGIFILTEDRMAPDQRSAEFRRALRLITRGPLALRHYALGMAAGILIPLTLLFLTEEPALWAVAGLLASIGLFVEEDTLVRAGQALSIS